MTGRWLPADRALAEVESERVRAYGLESILGVPERRELSEEQKREAEGWQQRHDDANYRRKLRKREIDAERKGTDPTPDLPNPLAYQTRKGGPGDES